MTNANAEVTYARAYDPYGVVAATSGPSQSAYAFGGEYSDSYIKLNYLRSRMYAPSTGRFQTKDSWQDDYNRPMSYNAWLYVYANPINLTDPSGHDPWWCEGRYDADLCYVKWNLDHGGKLTAGEIEAIYQSFPDETLQFIQEQFSIKLPAGYDFKMTVGGTIFPPSHLYKATFGVEWWFAYLNCSGTIIEVSEQHQLREFSTAVPSEGGHINTTVYITEHAFPDWKYNPDDIAGIMIHEATHAWQESVAVGYVVHPGQPGDPSSASWDEKYANGRERQAVDIALAADASGRIHMSSDLRDHLEDYRNEHEGGPIGRYFEWGRGPDFPYPLPPNVP